MIIIICPRCSRKFPEGYNNCGFCGAPLVPQMYDPHEHMSYRKQKNTNAPLVVAIVILVTIFLALALLIGYMLIKDKIDIPSFSTSSVQSQNDSTPTNVHVSKSPSASVGNGSSSTTQSSTVAKEQPEVSPQPSEPPVDTRTPKRREFLDTASSIANYEATYLNTATTQAQMDLESDIVFRKWDDLLNDVYKYLKTILSKEEFRKLESDELKWIRTKEAAIKEAGNNHSESITSTTARNNTGIKYTKERCYYLISLIY